MYTRTDIATGEDMGGSSKWSRNQAAYESGAAQHETLMVRKAAESAAASAAESALAAQQAASNKAPSQSKEPSEPKDGSEKKPSGGINLGNIDLGQVLNIASMFSKKGKKPSGGGVK
jgi:hypothetical protein